MTISVDIIGQAELEKLASSWNGLLEKTPGHSVFLRWEWMSMWARHFGDGKSLFLKATESGALIGIAPLARQAGGAIAFASMADLYPDHMDFILTPGRERDIIRAFIAFLTEKVGGWRRLRLRDAAENSVLRGADFGDDFVKTEAAS